jgi:hypothetical protein
MLCLENTGVVALNWALFQRGMGNLVQNDELARYNFLNPTFLVLFLYSGDQQNFRSPSLEVAKRVANQGFLTKNRKGLHLHKL